MVNRWRKRGIQLLQCGFAVILALSLVFSAPLYDTHSDYALGYTGVTDGISRAGDSDKTEAPASFTTSVSAITRGSVYLELTGEEFKNAGYDAGDLVSVDLGSGEPIVIPFIEGRTGIGFRRSALSFSSRDNRLTLRMSDGNFAEAYGITEEQIGQEVRISLAEKAGFLEEYKAWQIGMLSSERSDFPASMTDEEFANYRNVTTTGMGKGILYRTSSPINPMIKRNAIVDAANRKNKVTTVINLSETPESAAAREGYAGSYYSTSTRHYEADMKTDFGSDAFNATLARCLHFMIDNPGIYEVNCIFGKDRTGFVIAVLEGLMGASYDELVADYVATYPHYYPEYNNYEPVAERDRVIAEGNLVAQMEYAYGVDDLKKADIKSATENYLRKIGLTDKDIDDLRKCLTGGSQSTEPAAGPAGSPVVKGKTYTYNGQKYTVTSLPTESAAGEVVFKAAKNAKKVTVPAVIKLADGKTYKVTQISAKAFTGSKIRTVTIGKNVKKIRKNAFKRSKATKLIVKTKKLKKATVKNSLKGSKIRTIQVKVGKKSLNKKYVKKYKKIFTKKNAGKKAKVQ